MKRLLPRNLFRYFGFFYRYLGSSVFIALVASMMVAVLDGVGLTMFLPLLKVAGGGGTGDMSEEMGEMALVLEGLTSLGIPLTLINVLVLMFVFFSLKGVAKFCADYYRVVLQQRFANSLRLQNMQLLAGYDYRDFSGADSGRIQNTLSGEIERINNSYRYYFSMLQQGIMAMVYVFLAYVANPKFAIIVAVGGMLSNLLFSRIYKRTKQASRQVTAKMHRFQSYLLQSVSSFKFLKATDLITDYKRRIDQSIRDVEEEQRRIGTMTALSVALREPLIISIVVVAILVQVMIFEESLGLIILSLLFFYRGLTSLVSTQNFYNSFLGTSGSIDNMESFIQDLQSAQEDNGTMAIDSLRRGIEVRNLTYRYDEEPVVRGMTFELAKNETVGIVGESGAGKTTLANVICGLLRPPPGMVFIDGVDLTKLDIHTYRSRIGYVTQEAQVFTDTIYDNISFWAPRTPENEAKVRSVLKLAHAEAFVNGLPEGIDTTIGINGINLSGGQRQRVSIARELYREVDILVLDEATSALDSQSEKSIQQNIDSLSGSYTMIVIAHRLSTIKKADKIIYMKSDGTYDIGTFDALVDRSPTFRSMVSLQSMQTA